MTLKQISTILNTKIMKNAIGETVTVDEDLSNIVEVGKIISDLSADDLKDFQQKLAVGIYKNYVQARLYKTKDFKILKDAVAYGGGIQRIMTKDLASADDSHIINLIDGQDYFDGTYHGLDLSAKVYTEKKAFKVVWSVSDDTWRESFTSAEGVAQLFGLIEARIANTIEAQVHALTKRVICKLISDTYKGGRVIKLVTMYNQTMGYTQALTYAQIKADRDEFRKFNAWCNAVITRLVDYVAELNDNYNDGTVLTFTPKEKINVLLLSQFATEGKFLALSDTYNPGLASLEVPFDTVSSWQNRSNDIMPDYGVTAQIKDKEAVIDKVVGIIADQDAMGISVALDKISSQYIGSEAYTNFYHHMVMNFYVDSRNSAIVLTLE